MTASTRRTSTYPVRLPASIKAEAERLAAADGTSLNQFVATAVAEKVAALRTASYFAERKGHADWAAFERLTARPAASRRGPATSRRRRRGGPERARRAKGAGRTPARQRMAMGLMMAWTAPL
jgi:hypothetical protein